MQQTQAVSGKK